MKNKILCVLNAHLLSDKNLNGVVEVIEGCWMKKRLSTKGTLCLTQIATKIMTSYTDLSLQESAISLPIDSHLIKCE